MSNTGRHSTPPELAKDVLGKLDQVRALLERARAVAARADFSATAAVLVTLLASLETARPGVESALLADVRRALSGGSKRAE